MEYPGWEHVQTIVADELGVEPAAIMPESSLFDDLGADSLDLLGVAACLETEYALHLPTRRLAAVRTFGELVQLLADVLVEQHTDPRPAWGVNAPPRAWVVTEPSRGTPARRLHRVLVLTPYALELIAEDAARLGIGGSVDVLLDRGAPPHFATAVDTALRRARQRGVTVTVRHKKLDGERRPAPWWYGPIAVQRA